MSDMSKCGRCRLPAVVLAYTRNRCRFHVLMERVEEIESLCRAVLKDLQIEIDHQEEEMQEEEPERCRETEPDADHWRDDRRDAKIDGRGTEEDGGRR
jgi:hypothetical protein